jgi:hypothetical protein
VSLPVPANGKRAVRGSGWTALRFLLIGLTSLLVAGLTFATANNVATLAHRERTEPVALLRTGVAHIEECAEHGPVSRHGFGGWDSCTATVTWSDGSVETRRTERNFFQADEVGQDIQVGEINVRGKDRGYHPMLIRAEWPNDGTYIIAAIALCLIGALLLLGGVGYLLAALVAAWSAWRRRVKERAASSIVDVELPAIPIVEDPPVVEDPPAAGPSAEDVPADAPAERSADDGPPADAPAAGGSAAIRR